MVQSAGSPVRRSAAREQCEFVWKSAYVLVQWRPGWTLGVISPLTNSGRGIQGYSFPSIVLRVLNKQEIGNRASCIKIRARAPGHHAWEAARTEDRDRTRLERTLCDWSRRQELRL